MRYHYKEKKFANARYEQVYKCNHEVYSICTLFKIGDKGLGVIQQKYNPKNKSTFWTNIDSYLVDDIYLNINFKNYFDKKADICNKGLYPTVTIRQIMWALRMKPLKKERWETTFDRNLI